MPPPGPALSPAWLRAFAAEMPRPLVAGTWHIAHVALREGDGELTVRARRESDRVSVTVGFSDPRLQAQAAAHLDRLQSALEAHYGTGVDCQLMDHDGSGTPPDARSENAPSRSAASPDGASPARTAPPRPLHPGARNEWVG